MTSFIDSVQEYITKRFDNLQDIEIIVPNNRTGAALLSSLKKNATKVCWAPKITPIKNIFARNSQLHEVENIVLTYVLHQIFTQYIDEGNNSSFDNFYNFGEVLLSDFDDIDKYLVDPQKLFSNISDEKEIDVKFAGIDENLIEILKSFWTNVSKTSVLDQKIRSLELWQKMPEIYSEFVKELRNKGYGYQGMIYRDFVENRMTQADFSSANYAFVGFSALNQCEKELFRHINKTMFERNGQCLFFWDADRYYIDNHNQEAGLFLRSDLKEFPLPDGFELSNSIKNIYRKDIQVIEVPSSVAQTKLIPELLKKYDTIDGKTAIILGDEKLLVPLVYSLPENIENAKGKKLQLSYNITMGYPLSYTASASFVQIIMKLAMHRSSRAADNKTYLNRNDVHAAIMHSFSRTYVNKELADDIDKLILKSKIDYIDFDTIREQTDKNELLKIMFDVNRMKESFPKYIISVCQFVYENLLALTGFETESDFMHRIITLYTSFLNALGDNIAFEKDNMYYKLMTSMIKKSNLTFEGKSEDKMQILGFMETRSIDFDNIIMLSMNEDTFPKSNYKESMIPYNLRKAFSMPSIEFQNSIFAYYFYRLLQNCKSVSMIYSTEGEISHAEKSRFITQMEYELNPEGILKKESSHNITKSYEVRPSLTPPIEIKKSKTTMDKIYNLLGCTGDDSDKEKEVRNGAYPKLINTYLTCQIQFYFEYIERLKVENGIDDDTTGLDFGNLLHESCHYLYKEYIGKQITTDDFEKIKENIEDAINFAVCKVFNVDPNDKKLFEEAKANIMVNPIRHYIKKIVANDESHAPFQIVDLENEGIQKDNKKKNYTIEYPVGDKTVLLKGKIDRIDLRGDTMRVIDYKTSDIKDNNKIYDENFWIPSSFKNKEAAQVLIYSEIMSQLNDKCNIQPCIISVTNLDDYNLKYIDPSEKGNKKRNIESYADNVFINGNEVSLRDDLKANLSGILAKLLDENINLKQTENQDNCKYCPYKQICNK